MKKLIVAAMLLLPVVLLADEKVETEGYLGVMAEELSDAMKTALDVEEGVLISKVYKNSPAAKAGIEEGDVITKLDGEKIDSFDALKKAVSTRPKKKVAIIVKRSNKTMTKTVELAEREKKIFSITMDIPDFSEFKEALTSGFSDFEERIDSALEDIRKEIEELKKEIEELKKKQ
jgi:serine protease Do